MQTLALSWLVYRLTKSTVLMGTIGFCLYVPVLLLAPVAGIAADRYSRQRIVLATQLAFAVHTVILAALTLTGAVAVWHLAVLAVVWGTINAFDIPGRQSLYFHLVGKEDLPNAIALNSMTFNAARVVGPPIGGVLVAALGEGPCFAINAVTYAGVIVSLLTMRSREPQRVKENISAVKRLQEGFRYAWQRRRVRSVLAMTATANLAVAPAILLAPVFADAVFGRGSQGLGLLTGAAGVGAVAGTLVLAGQRDDTPLARVVLWSLLGMTLGLTAFAVSPRFLLSVGAMLIVGFGVFRQLAASNALIQSSIDDEYRGRIMGLYSMMAVGMLPVGNLLAGLAAKFAGVRWTVAGGGLLCIAAASLWAIEVKREDA